MKLAKSIFSRMSCFYLALVVLMPIIVFIEPLMNGKVLFWGLPATQFIPWKYYAWQELLSGHLPLWNPLNGLGSPLMANYQLAFFYPPGWILFGLMAAGGIEWMSWGYLLVNVMHLSWAGLGAALFSRSIGASKFGQVISGLSFGLCAYFTARIGTASMIWAGSWLPWVMLGGNRILKCVVEKNWRIPALPVIAIALQLLTGHAQLTWYTLMLFFAWTVFLLWRNRLSIRLIRAILLFVIVITVSIGLTSVQLIPTAEYLLTSQRSSSVDYEIGLTYSFWPWRLLTFFNPEFFGNPADGTYFGYASYWEDAVYLGFIPFVLAMSSLSLIARKKKDRNQHYFPVLFLWTITLIGFILALGQNTPLFPFLYRNIPTFGLFNGPTRFMIWAEFCISILAGLSATNWKKPEGYALKRWRLVTVGMGAISAGAGLAWMMLGDVRPIFISATAAIGLWGFIYCILTLSQPNNPAWKSKWQLGVLLIICIDLFVNNYDKTPTTQSNFYSERVTPAEIILGERAYIDKGDEYLLKFSRFFRFSDFRPIEDWRNIRLVMLPNINLIDGFAMVNNFDPLTSGRYSRVLDDLDGILGSEKIKLLKWLNVGIWEKRDPAAPNGVDFLEIQPWGRYRWAACALAVTSADEAWEQTRKLVVDDVLSARQLTVVEHRGFVDEDCSSASPVRIKLIQEDSQYIKLEVIADAPGYLVVANSFFPGWKAKIDGESVPVIRADYLFYAVGLKEGSHKVILEYLPESFYIGLLLTGIFFAIVIISGILNLIYQKSH